MGITRNVNNIFIAKKDLDRLILTTDITPKLRYVPPKRKTLKLGNPDLRNSIKNNVSESIKKMNFVDVLGINCKQNVNDSLMKHCEVTSGWVKRE